MDIEVKTKIATYLVDKIFIPQVNIALKNFTHEIYETARFQIEYKLLTGYNIGVEKIVVLDLGQASRQLVTNIVASFVKNENQIEKKE